MAGLQDLDLSLTGVDHLDQHGRRGWQARDTCNGEAWGARVNPRDPRDGWHEHESNYS